MLDNIKTAISNFFEKSKNTFLAIFAGIAAVLFLILKLKQHKVNELEAQVSLAKTQKDADVIEADIKGKMAEAQKNNAEVSEYESALAALAAKRAELKASNPGSDKDEENYWNK